MKRALLSTFGLLFAALLGAGLFTAWALESGGVAIVETQAPDGSLRRTHVWFVEPEGALWIEAGTPQNPWFLDMERDPRLTFSAEGRSGDFAARRVAVRGARDRIRGLLREKYGIRDRWVGVLFDTSRSIAVELVEPGGQ
jgi:hypothetical protein